MVSELNLDEKKFYKFVCESDSDKPCLSVAWPGSSQTDDYVVKHPDTDEQRRANEWLIVKCPGQQNGKTVYKLINHLWGRTLSSVTRTGWEACNKEMCEKATGDDYSDTCKYGANNDKGVGWPVEKEAILNNNKDPYASEWELVRVGLNKKGKDIVFIKRVSGLDNFQGESHYISHFTAKCIIGGYTGYCNPDCGWITMVCTDAPDKNSSLKYTIMEGRDAMNDNNKIDIKSYDDTPYKIGPPPLMTSYDDPSTVIRTKPVPVGETLIPYIFVQSEQTPTFAIDNTPFYKIIREIYWEMDYESTRMPQTTSELTLEHTIGMERSTASSFEKNTGWKLTANTSGSGQRGAYKFSVSCSVEKSEQLKVSRSEQTHEMEQYKIIEKTTQNPVDEEMKIRMWITIDKFTILNHKEEELYSYCIQGALHHADIIRKSEHRDEQQIQELQSEIQNDLGC